MSLSNAVKRILASASRPMTPREIRDIIKTKYPDSYGTAAHVRNVAKGHYADLDHALLAQIYTLVRVSGVFSCNKNSKPMTISLTKSSGQAGQITEPADGTARPKASYYEDRVKDILANAKKYQESYYKADPFRGPSLYFHLRALETRHSPRSSAHKEYVYATLASWGMHRMGKGGSKMQSFDTFCKSVEPIEEAISEAQQFDVRKMNDDKWLVLERIFKAIKVMVSGTSLVGNSKVMHHMLPNIVPPIDRNYTLRYLQGHTSIKNDLNHEWKLMKEIISSFFIPVACNGDFAPIAYRWMARKAEYPWDTSILKIVDNLVIGSKK